MESTYLVRYGLMRHIGRFASDRDGYARGQTVVVQSPRGTELGEILAPAAVLETSSRLLRLAGPEDLERARLAELDRPRCLEACERIFRDGRWPLDLLDVEPLLDDRRTILYYLGPHRVDAADLLRVLRETCGFEAILEPLGRDEPSADTGCGSCGSGGGCSGCAVKDLIAGRRVPVS